MRKISFFKKLLFIIPGYKELYKKNIELENKLEKLNLEFDRNNLYRKKDFSIDPESFLYTSINDYQSVLYKPTINIYKIYGAPDNIFPSDFEYFLYFRSLSEDSYNIVNMDTSRIDIFFSVLDRFEKNLFELNLHLPGYCSLYEQHIYKLKRNEIVESFLNRSYNSAISHSYGLQRVKNRIDNMENWFFNASHYDKYFSLHEKMIIEQFKNDYITNHKPLFEKRST